MAVFTSYQMVSSDSASLNTGSYFNSTEYTMFVRGYVNDLWYAFSSADSVEVGVWDRSQNLIGWNTLNQSKSYNEISLTYLSAQNFPVSYSYKELNSDFIQYKNEKLLVNPAEQLSASFQIITGSYFLTYNFVREMAGTPPNPLIIKEISPSRKELKLYPISASDPPYEAFCTKKVLMRDVSPLYLQSVKECPYAQIYSKVSPLYPTEINTLKTIFFLNGDGAVENFFKNLYEDTYIYTTAPVLTKTGVLSGSVRQNLVRIQGIKTDFNNYLLSNSDTIVDFSDLDVRFRAFTSASIERKFSPIGKHPIPPYDGAKTFVYDFFTKYFYAPISEMLSSTYKEKYFGHFRNSLNLGNNRLLQIVSTDMMDERVEPTDPLTLLVKLQSELPNDLDDKSQCWVSNTSLIPFVVSAIIKSPSSTTVHQIGPPNFSIPIPDASLTNVNRSYTAAQLQNDENTERNLTVSRNINELEVDYTNFSNFVVFSSAELRLKIFKNKVTTISSLSSSLLTLDNNNTTFLAASGSTYPYYTHEYSIIQGQLNDVFNSFDGYESHLYQSGYYGYANGAFISASYVAEMDLSASSYDKTNMDSLINNCPEHILVDSNNDEYIIFLSMIGHFFDDIYIYIANMPSEKNIGYNATEEFTRRIVDYMLETFGWSLDDSLEQASLINNYLTSEQQAGLNSMSAEDRLKTIRNRLLTNLPRIYKTKGTEEAVRFILACYGIPSSLLSIREYGGTNYMDDSAAYTTYERVYLRQWDTSSKYDNYALQCPTGSYTYLFKLSIDDSTPYVYDREQVLFGKVLDGVSQQSISASGEWAVSFTRIPKKNAGKLTFRIGYKNSETFQVSSPEFPLFNGEIYSVMLRRNLPDDAFQYTSNFDSVPTVYDLYVQRNERGEKVLSLTSSAICYNSASNIQFTNGGGMNIIGWFADYNGQGYTGVFDKFQIWNRPITDSNFEDYVNNINAYSFSGSYDPHEALMFRMHVDYPFNQRAVSFWKNANPYYTTGSFAKTEYLFGYGANLDYMSSSNAWSGSLDYTYDSASCRYITQSVYPYQFKVLDYPSTWGISKYGPNKFQNEKVRHVSQSIEARFDTGGRSTYVKPSGTTPDSNQVGFFADPQDFKNKDIIRHFGNYDFMDAIGDPGNQFSSSYDTLKRFRKEYADGYNELSGSKTLFNEIMILYKLYFNRSIFEAIKNVVPARANALVGVLIEPTVLERPKYQSKPIFTEANSGSVFYADVTASHYFRDGNTKLVRLTESVDFGLSSSLDISYLNLPNRDYPVNYGGNYITDASDAFSMAVFASGIFIPEIVVIEQQQVVEDEAMNFFGSPLVGITPLGVQFITQSVNALTYLWDFGDGNIATGINPLHTYTTPGTYTVSLTAYYVDHDESEVKSSYVTAYAPVTADFSASPSSGNMSLTVAFTNLSTGATTYLWNFGDGTTSTVANPSHVYSNAGTYNVSLSSSNAYASASVMKPSFISVTTPPVIPSIPCGGVVQFSGGESFPNVEIINLGSGNGTVLFAWTTGHIPDKFQVWIEGVKVMDTGYRGSTAYQSNLNTNLSNRGLPKETITAGESGVASFYKSTAYPYAIVMVYAPLGMTQWEYTMYCPI